MKTPKLHLVLRRLHRSLAVLLLLLHFLTVSELFLNPKTETGVSVNVSQMLFLPFICRAPSTSALRTPFTRAMGAEVQPTYFSKSSGGSQLLWTMTVLTRNVCHLRNERGEETAVFGLTGSVIIRQRGGWRATFAAVWTCQHNATKKHTRTHAWACTQQLHSSG